MTTPLDVDTLVGAGFTAGWEATTSSKDHWSFWQLCDNVACTTLHDSGVVDRPYITFDGSSVSVGNTYVVCVIQYQQTGVVLKTRSCSDGIALQSPGAGTTIGTPGNRTWLVEDTTWTLDGSPYTVQGEIQVGERRFSDTRLNRDTTLTIDPGVVVKFASSYATIQVTPGANLYVEGTAQDHVLFTTGNDDLDADATDEMAVIQTNFWDTIRLDSNDNVVEYLDMRYMVNGIRINGNDNVVRNSTIASVGNTVSGNRYGSGAIDVYGKNNFVDNVDVSGHWNGILVERGGSATIEDTLIHDNRQGILINTSTSSLYPITTERTHLEGNDFEDNDLGSYPASVSVLGNGTGFGPLLPTANGNQFEAAPTTWGGSPTVAFNVTANNVLSAMAPVDYPDWTGNGWGAAHVPYCYRVVAIPPTQIYVPLALPRQASVADFDSLTYTPVYDNPALNAIKKTPNPCGSVGGTQLAYSGHDIVDTDPVYVTVPTDRYPSRPLI